MRAESGEGKSAGVPGRDRLGTLVRLSVFFAVAAFVLIGIFNSAEWYADRVAMPRYCADPSAAVARVHHILTQPPSAEGSTSRPYLVAAKLIYLVPRRSGESVQNYTARLHREIKTDCG